MVKSVTNYMTVNSNYARMIGGNKTTPREKNDYYATPPKAIDALLSKVELSHEVWEPACGGGHLSNRLFELGYDVHSTDIVDRGYSKFNGNFDFLSKQKEFNGDIVTNPPFKDALQFVLQSLADVKTGNKVCMFLKVQFLESQKRKEELFSLKELKKVLVFSKRITTVKNGEFDKYKSSALCNAWFVWEKGYKGLPTKD